MRKCGVHFLGDGELLGMDVEWKRPVPAKAGIR